MRRSRRGTVFGAPRRTAHPDDVLKRLARHGATRQGPTVYTANRSTPAPNRAALLTLSGVVLVIGGVVALPFLAQQESIKVDGLSPRTFLTPDGRDERVVMFSTKPESAVTRLKIRVDGQPAKVVVSGKKLRWVPGPLGEGSHRLTLTLGKRLLWRSPAHVSYRVDIDSINPTLTVVPSSAITSQSTTVLVSGETDSDATVSVNGNPATMDNGAFTFRFKQPPIGMLRVVATDKAGNTTTVDQRTMVRHPEMHGVRVSAAAWASPGYRNPILELAAANRINTVVLDLKDENGQVGYQSKLTRVSDVGAALGAYDLPSAVNDLHRRGLRVVGRIVVFRDPLLARASVNSGHLEDVVETGLGGVFDSRDGAFTNPFSKAVREYNLAIIEEAASLGVDDIVLDDVRRPPGPLDNLRFAGLDAVTIDALATSYTEFVERVAARLQSTGVRLGVSVEGSSLRHIDRTGEDVGELAKIVDYVLPRVMPSSWPSGSYSIGIPSNFPELIVGRALDGYANKVKATDAAVIPWLQDHKTPSGRSYGQREIRAQISAARANGIDSFVLWDPEVTYNPGGPPVGAPAIAHGGVVPVGASAPPPTTA